MSKVKLRNCNRKKAFLGALLGSAVNAAGSYLAAKMQADATEAAAKSEAEALQKRNENDTKLQEQALAEQRKLHEQEMRTIENIQLAGQMQAGQQNINQREQASRIKFKSGGYKRRLRNTKPVDNNTIEGEGGELLLVNSNSNNPYTVLDGGTTIYLGKTNQGNDLYQIVGDSHNQYHKAQGGKSKTGVGIRFKDNTKAGFLSKHSVHGFNPTKAVAMGMEPELALNIQENSKTPVERNYENNRSKAELGFLRNWYNGLTNDEQHAVDTTNINFLGNAAGAAFTMLGNTLSAKRLKSANNSAYSILKNAYSNLRGIDLGLLDKNNYRAAHALAALQSPRVDTSASIATNERALMRGLKTINNSGLSSAAIQNRNSALNTSYVDTIGGIQEEADKLSNEIALKNNANITEVSMKNAELDTAARQSRMKDYLEVLKYNNEIENSKILGMANADTSRILGNAKISANRRLANWSSIGNVFTTAGKTLNDTMEQARQNNTDRSIAMVNASPEYRIQLAIEDKSENLLNLYKTLYPQYSELIDKQLLQIQENKTKNKTKNNTLD